MKISENRIYTTVERAETTTKGAVIPAEAGQKRAGALNAQRAARRVKTDPGKQTALLAPSERRKLCERQERA
ncbi:hypothetical protein D6C00_14550 [Thiohalobacter thiocyanaticus]|uniref:Uncharacterized protein n=1 Tax=Thiohalobacter thiocyanaticus TaxID=585455 RepID=A0A426QDZ8_9GAMM|nr:hypothetical protein D6C00_14550 [Thiohalobacter thiocyanaticus]